jgi:A/G-specific adenine glycosylase
VSKESPLLPAPYFPENSGDQPAILASFSDIIYSYYREYGRTFPWRETRDPYRILLSEMMLQQTQTERVLPKYELFLSHYPSLTDLNSATLTDILSLWKGLGYNRRALALKQIAQRAVDNWDGTLPESQRELLELPMVGPATSAALLAFAYSKPSLYLETNIRRVFIYFFFHDQERVSDREIYPLLERTLDTRDPRSWYYALMDYGVFLKQVVTNPNRRSAHYAKQGKFEHSNRQLRGQLLSLLTEMGSLSIDQLCRRVAFPEDQVLSCLGSLEREGFLQESSTGEASPKYRLR